MESRSTKKSTYNSRIADKFVVRLEDGLRDEVAEVARDNHRSMNAEIIVAIKNHISVQRLQKLHTVEKMALIHQIEVLVGVIENLSSDDPEKQKAGRDSGLKLIEKLNIAA